MQQAYSLLSQHKIFIEGSKKDKFISNYMRWIGHTEFGPNYIPIHKKTLNFKNDLDINHWIEQWYLSYHNCLERLKNKDNVYFICYEQLCTSTEYWLDILKILDVKETYDFYFRESQKNILFEIENGIGNKASSLYVELSNIALK
jgi:hypothetical protein